MFLIVTVTVTARTNAIGIGIGIVVVGVQSGISSSMCNSPRLLNRSVELHACLGRGGDIVRL